MNINDILSKLADNPGATAKEIGATPVLMGRLAEQGKVIIVGERRIAGKRGRPAKEYAMPGNERNDESVLEMLREREALNRLMAEDETERKNHNYAKRDRLSRELEDREDVGCTALGRLYYKPANGEPIFPDGTPVRKPKS